MLYYSFPFFIFFLFSTLSPKNSAWELIESKDNIEVYTRTSARSSIKEVRIKATFKTNLDNFMYVLDHAPDYTKWVYKCSKAKRVHTVNEDEFYYYVATDLPFPASDRDMVVHSKKKKNPLTGGYDTHSVATNSYYSATEKMVQIALFESSWKIVQKDEETVEIDYQVVTEPGGMIPNWIVNLGITIGPVKTMEGLRELVEGK